MQRILVIGSPGAGKSTFARSLARRTGLPALHLDAEYWLPGWVEPAPEHWDRRLDELLAGDSWIIDGNYGGSMDRRLTRADGVIFLDYPTWRCLWQALKRIITLHGQVRPDAAPGCREKLDPEFLHYILMFRRAKLADIERRIAGFDGTVLRFRHPREAQAFLDRRA